MTCRCRQYAVRVDSDIGIVLIDSVDSRWLLDFWHHAVSLSIIFSDRLHFSCVNHSRKCVWRSWNKVYLLT